MWYSLFRLLISFFFFYLLLFTYVTFFIYLLSLYIYIYSFFFFHYYYAWRQCDSDYDIGKKKDILLYILYICYIYTGCIDVHQHAFFSRALNLSEPAVARQLRKTLGIRVVACKQRYTDTYIYVLYTYIHILSMYIRT